MGKYEVTVGQFRRFVEAAGYLTEAERGGTCWAVQANRRSKPAGTGATPDSRKRTGTPWFA